MWSWIQYRRIGRDVEEEIRRKSRKAKQKRPSDDAEKERADLESGNPPSPLDAAAAARLASALSSSRKEPQEEKDKREDPNRGHAADDRIVVCTSGDDDPLDPRNWSLTSRCKNIAILSMLIFVQAWAGASESMANTQASQAFHVGKTTESLSTAMYLFGVASGSLFVGPLSETVGKNPTYLVSTFCFLFFVAGSALTPTFGGQVVCRYFVGLFSSATLAINGSSVGDQFRPVKRSFVFPVIAWANVAPRAIAPIAGGWIVSNTSLGWRWTEWITLIISGAAFLVAFLFLPETSLPILLEWRAQHLRRLTGDARYVSEHAISASLIKRLKATLALSTTFFGTEPVIAVLGAYFILLYSLLFSFLAGFDFIFKQTYGLSDGLTGVCFAAIAAGSTAFTLGAPIFYDSARKKTGHVRGSPIKPEYRLWPAIVTAPLLPISLCWLGWTNYPSISIWSGLGACFVFGVVLIAIYVSSYEYIIDSYAEHAAVALASITMARYLVTGGVVIATRPMFEGIGVHWTMTLLACIAAIMAPAPLVFFKYGSKLRAKSPFAKGDDD